MEEMKESQALLFICRGRDRFRNQPYMQRMTCIFTVAHRRLIFVILIGDAEAGEDSRMHLLRTFVSFLLSVFGLPTGALFVFFQMLAPRTAALSSVAAPDPPGLDASQASAM